jgi:hypothetical protein
MWTMSFKEFRTDAKLAVGAVKDGMSNGAYLMAMAIIGGCLAIAVAITLVASALQ